MENEENPRRALLFSSAFQHKEGFYFEGCLTRPVGILLKQQTKSEIRDLEVMKRKASEKENGNPLRL